MDDPRPPEQIKEEEELTKRLKQVYKLAKINAAKKKKAKGDDDGDDDGSHAQSASKVPLSARSNGSSPSPMAKEYKPSKGHETIKEGENEDEDGEQEDEDDHFGSDDEEAEVRHKYIRLFFMLTIDHCLFNSLILKKQLFEQYLMTSLLSLMSKDLLLMSFQYLPCRRHLSE